MEKYFFFGLLLGTLLFTFFIFRPFWAVLVLGISFAIVLQPVYEWFQKGRLPNWLASLFTVTLFVALLVLPLLGLGSVVGLLGGSLVLDLTWPTGAHPDALRALIAVLVALAAVLVVVVPRRRRG